MKKSLLILLDYFIITMGTFLMAIGLVLFLEPYTIAPGGVTGLAIVIRKLSGIPIDVTNLVVNIPLFIGGLVVLGKKFGIKTAYATIALSASIRFIYTFFDVEMFHINDMLLVAIYGGVIMGVGIGLVFKTGGTTGGTDLAGAILHKFFPHISIPKLMMFLDLLIVFASGVVERKLETALYSIIALYIVVKIADSIIEGLNYAKEFIIISDKYEEIGKAIINNMQRGATVLKSQGLYTGKEKNVLLCIVSRAEVATLKKLIQEIDEKAFVTVNSVHEVMGEGFEKK